MLLLVIRCVILYLLTIIALRIMGKRQLGQLQPSDFVVILVISEMVSVAIQSNTLPLLSSVVPIITISILQILLSQLSLKSQKIRKIISGSPIVVIQNGRLIESAMVQMRINISDLLEQCRNQGYFDLNEIAIAIFETNGELSILPQATKRPVTPQDLQLSLQPEGLTHLFILDGHINHQVLHFLGYDESWLRQQLQQYTTLPSSQILIAGYTANQQFFWQAKDKAPQQAQTFQPPTPPIN